MFNLAAAGMSVEVDVNNEAPVVQRSSIYANYLIRQNMTKEKKYRNTCDCMIEFIIGIGTLFQLYHVNFI